MAATVKGYAFNSSGPTATDVDSADSGSIKFGRDDSVVSTTSVPIPTATGTKWSYLKYVGLDVTATSTTSISNRKISSASGYTTGLAVWWASQKTYTQNTGTQDASIGSSTAGNYPGDDTSHNLSGITLALQHVAAPTNTVNGAGLGSTGQTAIPVASGGTNYQNGQTILLGANTANAELVTVNGTPTATSIPCTATTKTHASGDVLGLGYQSVSTTATVYDPASVSTGSTGLNGMYLQLAFAVDNTYTGGGGAASLPSLVLTYDEQ
jgi:hypothetical protein